MGEDQQPQQQNRWGDPISEERQNELRGYLERWENEQDHGERMGPFGNGPGEAPVPLTGADVFWLAEQEVRDRGMGTLSNLHLERVRDRGMGALSTLRLEGAHRTRAHPDVAACVRAH